MAWMVKRRERCIRDFGGKSGGGRKRQSLEDYRDNIRVHLQRTVKGMWNV